MGVLEGGGKLRQRRPPPPRASASLGQRLQQPRRQRTRQKVGSAPFRNDLQGTRGYKDIVSLIVGMSHKRQREETLWEC